MVGSIADQMLTDNARQHVAQILGFDLKTAGPWLDCVKSVARKAGGTFAHNRSQPFEIWGAVHVVQDAR